MAAILRRRRRKISLSHQRFEFDESESFSRFVVTRSLSFKCRADPKKLNAADATFSYRENVCEKVQTFSNMSHVVQSSGRDICSFFEFHLVPNADEVKFHTDSFEWNL